MQDADAQVSKKISGGPSSPGLTRLGSALAQRMPQTDTQNSSLTASKGPTVMEVHILTYRTVPRTVFDSVQSEKSCKPSTPQKSCAGFACMAAHELGVMAPAAQAQECGEQFQLQDDLQYALDGLCSSALPADRAASAAKLAQMGVTRRGRLAFR